jgi:1-phosphofructokinase family hexose kinase
MIRCVVANPSIDHLFVTERLVRGGVHRPSLSLNVAGGKGLNVARVLTSLGGAAEVRAILAGHAGRWVRDQLTQSGMPGRYVWVAGETRSCMAVATAEDDGRLTEFNEPGPPIPPAAWSRFVQACVEGGGSGSWLLLSGSLPPGAPADGYRTLTERARQAGWSVALDSHGSALATALEASPTLVKLNLAEAGALLPGAPPDPVRLAHALQAGSGGAVVAITLGTDGALLLLPDGRAWRARVEGVGPYPVGSGDAFLGGLVLGHARGAAWPDALRLAVGAGAANAMEPGAGRLDPALARRLAGGATIEAIAEP